MTNIAIIGAGLAGLTAAKRLQEQGFKVTIFEKSRGLGGRLATRRRTAPDGAPLSFDHGAQFFTVRDPAFAGLVQSVAITGQAVEWRPRIHCSDGVQESDWWVASPGMSSLVKPWSQSFDVRAGARVVSLDRDGSGWSLRLEDEARVTGFDMVVLTVPVAQAIDLLPSEATGAKSRLAKVAVAPCWAGLFAFEMPLNTAFDVWRLNGPVLNWVARNGSKADRPAADCWVVHATPEWSAANLERDAADVVGDLQAAFSEVIGTPAPPAVYAEAHRWRYARTTVPLGETHLADCDGTLLIGGDWCLGARVENAFQSGVSIAKDILSRASIPRAEELA